MAFLPPPGDRSPRRRRSAARVRAPFSTPRLIGHLLLRLWLLPLLALAGCPASVPVELPPGIELSRIPAPAREQLRATLAIADVLVAEQPLVLDVDAGTIAGELLLGNVGAGGTRPAVLRLYGRLSEATAEVLLGEATAVVDVRPGTKNRLDFAGASFDVCGGADVCALRFDENRNGRRNVDDLYAGVDPAPQAPFLAAADTLQFASGLRVGGSARQVLVIENTAPHPVRIDAARVAGGQGIGLSTYAPGVTEVPAPRRVLDAAFFDGDGDGASDLIVAPGEEAFFAVTFAPANAFLTTASVHVVAVDTVTLVEQAVPTKVIGNADGALRPADPSYVEPTALTSLTTAGGTVRAVPFPAAELFSGVEIAGVDDPTTPAREERPLAFTGTSVVIGPDAIPADVAFVVDVAPGQRFAAVLAGLAADGDIDLAVVDATDPSALALIERAPRAGASAEAIEVGPASVRRQLAVLLGRIERDGPRATAGALTVDEPAPFRLACQLTSGPAFVDADAVVPTRGRLGGGIPLALRGTGFFVPADATLGPHIRVTVDGVVVVGIPRVTTGGDGLQTLTVVLPPGAPSSSDIPVSITVENPSSAAGTNGDGQAATLAGAFRYDLPTPRLASITPARTTTTGDSPLTLRGAFFFDRYGPPVVAVDGRALPAAAVTFVDAGTVTFVPGPLAAGSVAVSVQNRVDAAALTAVVDVGPSAVFGEPSNARTLVVATPEGPPPVVTAVRPPTGSTAGGELVAIDGEGFGDAVDVFFGGTPATVVAVGPTSLTVATPSSTVAGAVDVVIQNRDGQTGIAAGAFRFAVPAPTVDAVTPQQLPASGGTPLTVTGTGFTDAVAATFTSGTATFAVSALVSSSTRLVVFAPALPVGPARLAIGNESGVAEVELTVIATAADPPVIVAIEPDRGDVAGGQEVTVRGDRFTEPLVIVGDQNVAPLSVDDTSIVFAMPAGDAGVVAVVVVNADGQADDIAYTRVDSDEPALLAATPTQVHAGVPGDEVVLFGEHLERLGSPVLAHALVDTNGATSETTLSVTTVVPTLARATITGPTPPGQLRVRLAGPRGFVISPAITAVPPDVTRLQIDFTTPEPEVLLLGDFLAGDRLLGIAVGGTPCAKIIADERLVLCRVAASDAAVLRATTTRTLRLDYGGATPLFDEPASVVVRDDPQ
jgi:hypothetical protein